jgi:8-oxo-dGTP diphosphatase
VRRRNPPFRGRYALPGGFVDIGETVERACRRELMEETAERAGRFHLVGVYLRPQARTAGAHMLRSISRIRAAAAKAGDDAQAADWIKDWSRFELAFDHATLLADAKVSCDASSLRDLPNSPGSSHYSGPGQHLVAR